MYISHTIYPEKPVDFNTYFKELRLHSIERDSIEKETKHEDLKLNRSLGFFKVDSYGLTSSIKKLFLILILSFSFTSYGQTASYYHNKFQGRKTASGEIYDHNKLTCASNIYKLGTILKVTNLKNNKFVIVKVNDTGKLSNITLDLSQRSFKSIANLSQGIIKVKIELINNL